MRILLAEDDSLLGDGLRAGLRQLGFLVDWVRDGEAAERELRAQPYTYTIEGPGMIFDLPVLSIDTINFAGTLRKRISLPNEYWYENIGSSCGLPYNGYGLMTGASYLLNCYYENDTLKYHNENYPTCYYNYDNLTDFLNINNTSKIYPNPVYGSSILKLGQPNLLSFPKNNPAKVMISDATGRIIRTENIPESGEIEINRMDFQPGMYFYRISTGFVIGKFIIL
jgi:hypothetical protein